MNKSKETNFWLFVITGMLLIITTTGFARMAYGVILPFMQEGLAISTSKAGLLGTILFLGYLITVGTSGFLSVRMGAKRTLLLGGLFVVLGLGLLSYSPSFLVAALGMFLQGAGSALVYTPLMSIVVSAFPDKRGTVMGLLLSGAGIGMLLSGILVPFFIHLFPQLSFRAPWLLFALMTFAVLILAFYVLQDSTEEQAQQSKEKTLVWRTKGLYVLAIVYFFVGVVYLIPNLYQVSFMVDVGYSNQTAGSIYALAGVCSILGAPIWGIIADKIGAKIALIIALFLSVIGDLLPIILHNIPVFMLSSVIWGSSLGGVLLLIQMKASQEVKPVHVSLAIGFISIFYAVGQMLGPGLAGFLIEYAGGFRSAYLLGTIVFMICVLISTKLKSKSIQEASS